jgi:hypothetical protein
MTAEEYLKLVEGWDDPNPPPIVETHGRVEVVRDDKLEDGSKARFLDYLVSRENSVKEWVFGSSPAAGYGQISLAYLCHKYGKKSVFFACERKRNPPHPCQQKAIAYGAEYHWVFRGLLTVTQSRARKYVEENPDERRLLPLGLDHPTAIGSIIKVARGMNVNPKEIWSVGSGGVLTRGLQLAFPEAQINVVQVGHKLKPSEYGRAKVFVSPYKKLSIPVKEHDAPPFPSASTYDAKAWPFVRVHGTKGALFWNVAA